MPTYVNHRHIVRFGSETVNLRQKRVQNYRNQVNALRQRIEAKIEENPEFDLVKMIHSGSVTKGTALSVINDMDVAVYVRRSAESRMYPNMLAWLAKILYESNPNMRPEQFTAATHCVSIDFRGSGLNVDVVPVLYDNDPQDRGLLLNRETGSWVETSIPLHLEFIRSRSRQAPRHFSQVIRLIKWWIRIRKDADQNFRFKSFIVELICAHLLDQGHDFSDYTRTLQKFFSFVVQSELKTRIAFNEYYDPSHLQATRSSPIEILDPVNPSNNVGSSYSDTDRNGIVESCADALDALTEAQYADSWTRAVDLWKEILGPSFKVQS